MNAFELIGDNELVANNNNEIFVKYESATPTGYDKYIKLYYPSELDGYIFINTLELIRYLAISYYKLLNAPLDVKLTGFDDNLNCRFEADFISNNGSKINLLFLLVNGIPNVISN